MNIKEEKDEMDIKLEEEIFYLDDFLFFNNNKEEVDEKEEKVEEEEEEKPTDDDISIILIKPNENNNQASGSSKFDWKGVYHVCPNYKINFAYAKAKAKKNRFPIEYNKFNKSIWKHLEINLQVIFSPILQKR